MEQARALYAEHFARLREDRVAVEAYEVWQSRQQPNQLVTIKRFKTRADERAHHESSVLKQFVKDLGALCASKPSCHEVELMDAAQV